MNTELTQEQQRVNQVVQLVHNHIETVEQEVGLLKEDVVDIRKHFWDDVTVNDEHPDDITETFISMKQQAEVLSQRERSHRHGFQQLAVLRKLQDSCYFGRIDFSEESTSAIDAIYIGLASLMDDSGTQFLIYDWRAPVSSLYYDYPPGTAHYETPGGTIEGEIHQKRQYLIRDGVIRTMFDTSITIGDDLLQQVLGRSKDLHMKSIVATIQQEQNRIIRHDGHRLLIVQGAAGSGKTSAALQRVAYLLYKHRDTLRADQIVLFSPNSMFNSYVSSVLPELGEENMQQTTFQEYLENRLGGTFIVEDPYSQLEYALSGTGDEDNVDTEYQARIAGIRFKASYEFFEGIKLYMQSLESAGMIFRGLRFRGQVIITAQQLVERFYSYNSSIRFHNRIGQLAEWVMEELNALERKERTKSWVQDEIQSMSAEDYQQAYELLSRKQPFSENTFNDFERENVLLSRVVIRKHMKPLRNMVRALRFVDMIGIYKRLFSKPATLTTLLGDRMEQPELWEEVCRRTVEKLERKELAYEDATPYLLLKELIEGFQTNSSIKHVFVDEAQDYSPFQFEFMKRLFPRAQMTVLGDFNQAIYAHSAERNGFDSLPTLYGADVTETIILTRSYRSTKPIVEFACGLIAGGEAIIPFEREGDKPTVTYVDDHAVLHQSIISRIDTLKAEGYQTIAVIGKTTDECVAAFEALHEVEGIQLMTKQSTEFDDGVSVIPSYLAKGIEFDAVIVYNASQDVYNRESERRLFYTVCTRAMHRLDLFVMGAPSPFLSSADADTYTV
ncbi:MAG: RNA polymerase recycling motor HelD [Paenibacillaceae bacterium]